MLKLLMFIYILVDLGKLLLPICLVPIRFSQEGIKFWLCIVCVYPIKVSVGLR